MILNKIRDYILRSYYKEDINFTRERIQNASSSSSSNAIVAVIKRLGLRFGDLTSTDFEELEYDFLEIDNAYETDSYVRQGIDKYIEQCFKEGYTFYSKNPACVDYIKLRFKYMAETTQTPTDIFLVGIAEDIVKYSNVILAKARKKDESQLPPGVTITGIDGKEPVVGYFPIHPGTVLCKRDKFGTVKSWKQEMDGGESVTFKAEDVVHMTYKQKKGNLMGTPFLISVLDDIRALRFLEENVINMVYKHVNPFIHVAVGDDDSPGSKDEVQEIEDKMNTMDPDSGLITTNRVKINTPATNNAVDARQYLDYLENRVFSGLGVPGIAFGRGGTANRNTADSMTNEMSDRIEAIQLAIQSYINFFIIKELLIEGGFDPLQNPDNMVYFEFFENDVDRKIKFENHHTFLFEHNAITESELRDALGRDEITDRSGLYHELYTMTTLAAKGSTSSNADTNNKNNPTNQHGTKTSAKKNTNRELLEHIVVNNYKEVAKILKINDFVAKVICNSVVISKSKLNDSLYVENNVERVMSLVKAYNERRKVV